MRCTLESRRSRIGVATKAILPRQDSLIDWRILKNRERWCENDFAACGRWLTAHVGAGRTLRSFEVTCFMRQLVRSQLSLLLRPNLRFLWRCLTVRRGNYSPTEVNSNPAQ